VRQLLERVDLVGLANDGTLFLGKERKRRLVGVAVLAVGPGVIIVDEPTTGYDYRMVSSIMSLLAGLQKWGGAALITLHGT